MKVDLEGLRDRLLEASGAADEQTREIIAQVAADAVSVQARALAGEDVAELVAHLKAQTSMLTSSLRSKLNASLLEWLREVSYMVVFGILPP